MTVKRMDNVGIVVQDLDAAIEFFTDLGLQLEGRAPIEGDWADGVTGLHQMRVEIAMMRTPDGHSRLEISRFLAPPVIADHRRAPVNALGYPRLGVSRDRSILRGLCRYLVDAAGGPSHRAKVCLALRARGIRACV